MVWEQIRQYIVRFHIVNLYRFIYKMTIDLDMIGAFM